MTRFPVWMAWRETRAGWRHFLGFLACIALGVAAVIGVGSVAANLDRTLGREAKALVGGDLELRSTRPLNPTTEARLDRLGGQGATVARVKELVGMARNPTTGGALLVEVKAVDDAYPLYGRLETEPGRSAGRLGADEALVHEALLARLGLRLGAPLLIGEARFTITALIRREPDRSAGIVNLGPRVILSAAGLDRTGLIQFGSRVRHRVLVRLPETLGAAATRAALAREPSDPTVRISTFDEAQPGLRRFFSQLTTYLGLVGLASLLVGGIGVAASVRTFIRTRLQTIAILKCVGAQGRVLLGTYLLQTLALGALGSLAGAGLGLGVQALLSPLLDAFLPFEVDTRFAPWTTARGVALGVLTTLLSAAWPLLELRAVPPVLILRQPVSRERPRVRWPWLAALPIGAGLAALALWQAGSLRVGVLFLLASTAALALLTGVARGVRRLAHRLPRLPWLAWRHGLASLHRPGSQATGVVVALGIGVMLLVTVALIERGLSRQLDHERRREIPSFFFIDIQPDQVDRFARTLAAVSDRALPTLTPVIRSRLVAINGRPIVRAQWEGREDAWRVMREYVLTAAADPPAGNVVTRGRWWSAREAAARPQVSVEEEAARALGVDVGGRLTFDVQGVHVEAEVGSLRRVDWHSLSTNFFVIFSPGALDGAPMTYIATARVPPSAEAATQDAIAAAFPNVTAVPVRDVLERVMQVLEEIGAAVRVVAFFVLGAGLTVLVGALTQSRSQRLYESVLLRTLGARRAVVARAFAVEYGCLGLTAGLGGTVLGVGLAWIVLRFVLDVPWTVEPTTLALGPALTAALALAVGFLGTFRLLGQKPLAVLRRD